MAAVRFPSGVSEIVDQFDGFILDQYGVLHNGAYPLPGALDCLERLQKAGKKMVILSNSSRKAFDCINGLKKLGFDVDVFVGAVTSGEEASTYLRDNFSGKIATWMRWEGRESDPFIEAAEVKIGPIEEAEVLVLQGVEIISEGSDRPLTSAPCFRRTGDLKDHMPFLKKGVERGIPLVCANPDFQVLEPSGSRAFMPGVIAAAYEKLGGKVLRFGKPGKTHFEASVRMLELPPERVVHVGDSLEHDIAGACGAGLASIFIAEGIHKHEVSVEGVFDQATAATFFHEHAQGEGESGIKPTFALPLFKWAGG